MVRVGVKEGGREEGVVSLRSISEEERKEMDPLCPHRSSEGRCAAEKKMTAFWT